MLLALAVIGEVFTVPLGGAYLILQGALGAIIPGNGLQARRYIDKNAARILWAPLILAFEIIAPMWDNVLDFLQGPEDGSPPAPPPGQSGSYRVLPPGPGQRPSYRVLPPGQDDGDIEEILRKRGI